MSVPVSTEYSNRRHHRQGQNSDASGRMDGRKVNKSPNLEQQQQTENKRMPVPPSELPVMIIPNKDLAEFKARISLLDAEKSELAAALSEMKKQVEEFAMEKSVLKSEVDRLNAVLAVQPAAAAVTERIETGEGENVVLAKPGDEKAIQWPTKDNLEKILVDLAPLFVKYGQLGEEINKLRNDCQKVIIAGNYTQTELNHKIEPFIKTYNMLKERCLQVKQEVVDGINNLDKIIKAGSFVDIPDPHQKSFSSMNKISMDKISQNATAFNSALDTCRSKLKDMKSEHQQMQQRFFNAESHINKMGKWIDGTWATPVRVTTPFA